jgi:nitrogen fixation NifU-like protein
MGTEGRPMGDDFDDFVHDLQDQIFEETRVTYGDVAFQRWLKPLYNGRIELADGYGRVTGSCGDTVEIFLRFESGKVKQALFQTDGCGSSTVCGSFAAGLALGKSPDEVAAITGETILEILGGLPEEDRHCAFLAVDALHQSLHNFMMRRQSNNQKKNEDA